VIDARRQMQRHVPVQNKKIPGRDAATVHIHFSSDFTCGSSDFGGLGQLAREHDVDLAVLRGKPHANRLIRVGCGWHFRGGHSGKVVALSGVF
jgi:hypothetical protein